MARQSDSAGKRAQTGKSKARGKSTPKNQYQAPDAVVAAYFADDKRTNFAEQYLIDRNGTQAAIRAGYNPKSARTIASQLLRNPLMQQRIEERLIALQQRTGITQERVLWAMWSNATVDVNEIVQHRRVACRYCHGTDHEFQWTTEREWRDAYDSAAQKLLATMPMPEDESARAEHLLRIEAREVTGFGLPSHDGGFGYRKNLAPNPDCPECAGDGVPEVHIVDTRDMSPAARAAFEGVKKTRQGVEVKLTDRQKALEQLGRHLGMFNDKVTLDADETFLAAARRLIETAKPVDVGTFKDLPDDDPEGGA